MLLHFAVTCWLVAQSWLLMENVRLRDVFLTVCVCVCESLMTDNSSFEFGSVFVSDYTSVCLFGCVCVCVWGRESDGKREVCSVIKWLSNCREPHCVACEIVLPLWPEVSCSEGVCAWAHVRVYVTAHVLCVPNCDEFQLPASSLGRLPEHQGPSQLYFMLIQKKGKKEKERKKKCHTFYPKVILSVL